MKLLSIILSAALLSSCADFGKYVSAMDVNAGGEYDPNNPDAARVTIGGKIYFRDPIDAKQVKPVKHKKKK